MNTYKNIHRLLLRLFGPANNHTCPCGDPAVDWAYQYTGEPEIRDSDGGSPHSTNPDDYAAMCRSCHIRLEFEHNPAYADRKREGSRLGGAVRTAKMAADPEFNERVRETSSEGGKRGGRVHAERMSTDPDYTEQVRENMRTMVRRRCRCLECGMKSTIGGMNSHQHHSGHTGRENLE